MEGLLKGLLGLGPLSDLNIDRDVGPRPDFLPVGSSETSPSLFLTTRISCRLGIISPVTISLRIGTFLFFIIFTPLLDYSASVDDWSAAGSVATSLLASFVSSAWFSRSSISDSDLISILYLVNRAANRAF